MRRPHDVTADVPSRVLPASWFAFVMGRILRQACRYNDYVSLVTIRASRPFVGSSVDVGTPVSTELAEVIASTIRDTDPIGELPDGDVGILALDVDENAVRRLVERIADVIGSVHFSVCLSVVIGTAVCPTQSVEMAVLVEHAISHPMLIVGGHSPRFAGQPS